MEKLKMHSLDGVERNIELIGKLFPNAITEVMRDGKVEHAIDFDVLRQELSDSIVEGREERYQFTWPDKKKAMLAANAPITATLRPVAADSVGKDGTPGGFDSENLYIEGDNLEVLKLLQETYLGKVKMIYIDPPYNTGNDFVYEDDFAQTKKYRLGYKICGIAAGVVKGSALTQTAQTSMQKLAEKIDRNVVLCIMEHGVAMNIACSERGDSNMYMMKIGHVIPFYSTSAGRVFMAYMDRKQALEILEKETRTKTTPNTKTGLQELNAELDRIRAQGYSVIDEELQLGIQGVACPIFDINGEPAAALAFTSLKDGNEEEMQERIRLLKAYAEEISEAIRSRKRRNVMSEYSVELKGLNKVYSNLLKEDTVALKDINLQIRPGEFISIIGPSGCGKSTLLRIIGNLDKPTSGTIEYRDGADQQMGFVFQDSVLLPWKNVRQNAEFPLVIQKKQTEENEKKLDELLELAGLSEFKTALPRELSGGMKQRVSIVRALSYDAPLLLMDEPFGALDALTRDHLNEELLKIWQKTKKTVIFVTHSIEEATFLSDRVLVMSARPGRVKEMVEIDLPRPRGEATRNDPKFTEYNKYLRGIIG